MSTGNFIQPGMAQQQPQPPQPQPQPPIANAGSVNNSTFGVLVPGRPLLFEWSEVDTTHLTANINEPLEVSDISFFLLPGATLPAGMGATLHFSPPPYTTWTVLGAIYPERPSGTFRSGWHALAEVANGAPVRLGVSLESRDTINNLEQSKAIGTIAERGDWGIKLAQDLYNFMTSYSRSTPMGEVLEVSTSILDKWLDHFRTRYKLDPNFVLKSS